MRKLGMLKAFRKVASEDAGKEVEQDKEYSKVFGDKQSLKSYKNLRKLLKMDEEDPDNELDRLSVLR
jgi:hypothetical protein